MSTTASPVPHLTPRPASEAHRDEHTIPLWGLFIALLALTAAEVGLFEFWHHTAESGHPVFPKFAMVLLLLVFTLPKAAIVMIYFMHLKFEKQLIVTLALVPFVTALIAVLVTLTDNLTLKNQGKNANFVPNLAEYAPHHGGHKAPAEGAAAPEGHDGASNAEPSASETPAAPEAKPAAAGEPEE